MRVPDPQGKEEILGSNTEPKHAIEIAAAN